MTLPEQDEEQQAEPIVEPDWTDAPNPDRGHVADDDDPVTRRNPEVESEHERNARLAAEYGH